MKPRDTWQVYTRGEIPIYRLMPAFTGIYRYRRDYPDYPLRVAYSHQRDKLWWAWDRAETEHFWRWFSKRMQVKRLRMNHLHAFDRAIKQSNVAVERIRRVELKDLTTKELLDRFDYIHRQGDFAHMLMSSDIDAFDLFFNDHLYRLVKRFLKGKLSPGQIDDTYLAMTKPFYQSYLTQQKKKIDLLSLSRNKSAEEQARTVHEMFWWTSLGWESMRPHSKSYFIQQIKRTRKLTDSRIRAQLAAMRKETARIKKERSETISRFGFTREIRNLLELMDSYVKYHDLRKEMQVKSLYASHLLLREVGRRRRLPVETLEWMTPAEVKLLVIGGELDAQEVDRRRRSMFVLMDKDGIRHWSGQTAKKIHKREFDLGRLDSKTLQGVSASQGHVKGTVKVCSGAQAAIKKVKRGDILVCGMTLPDYLPAMKKASAIITDEGGITCHAAIISRELGIPCVINTKTATSVLKDGYQVEVDASKGVVTIL